MGKRKRRKFTPEFKAEVVELCRKGDRSITEVSRDLDLTESAVRHWVKQAEVDAGRGAEGSRAWSPRTSGLSGSEQKAAVGMSVRSIRSRLHRGAAHLRNSMRQ